MDDGLTGDADKPGAPASSLPNGWLNNWTLVPTGRRRLLALFNGWLHPSRKFSPTPGDLLVFVAGPYRYHRIVTGDEPSHIDATLAADGVPPSGWTRSDKESSDG